MPNNLDVAFCTYCGTKVVLNSTETSRERQKLDHYRELRNVAAKANNHKEVIDYCNRILEIDPSDVDSWIAKAVAVCVSSTEVNDGWQEAIEYLRTAKQLAPNDKRSTTIYNELSQKQAKWYLELAVAKLQYAHSLLIQGLDARQDTIKAMEYTLKGLKCSPDNLQYLESLEPLVSAGSRIGIQWGDEVRFWLQVLVNMRSRRTAENKLAELRDELHKQTTIIEKNKAGSSLFSAARIKNAEETIRKIKLEASKYEPSARYEPPRQQL